MVQTKLAFKRVKRETLYDLDKTAPVTTVIKVDVQIEEKKEIAAALKIEDKKFSKSDLFDGLSMEKIKLLAEKSRKFIGAHMSIAGGVDKSIISTSKIWGQSAAMFLRSARSWHAPPLTNSSIELFNSNCLKYGIDKTKYVVPHGSYLINLGNPDKDKRMKMYSTFLDDLKRCELLGIKYYNFHPGSTVGKCTKQESIEYITTCVNDAHKVIKDVVFLFENCAEQKCIGVNFDELRSLIDLVDDKSRVGICLDTCHLFAAGYDVRTPQKFDAILKEFDQKVGLKYLKALHMNDCKSDFKSGLDRHENIGKGKIGMDCFKFIMNDDRFNDIPIILETPDPQNDEKIYKKEVCMLYGLIDA